jgi:hypothetical protein
VVSYRDEKESLRARVAELEKELSERDVTIARLTGGAMATAPGDLVRRSRLMDRAAFVLLDRELDHEIDDAGFEAIAAFLRRRGAIVSQVGRSLHAHGFSLQCAGGRTRIRVSADSRLLPIATGIGALAAGAFVGLGAFALAHDLFDRSLAEAHYLWIAPLCMAMLAPASRWLARKGAARSEQQLHSTLAAVLLIAKEHPLKSPPVRVRVDDAADAGTEEETAAPRSETGARIRER